LQYCSISGGFPPFHIPDITLAETLKIISYALIMASVGINKLLTINLVDEITEQEG
jgi:SulP family sulfate permease